MPKRNLIWIVVIILAAIGVAVLSRRPARDPAQPEAHRLEPLHRLDTLSRDQYYRQVGPEVIEGAVRGYLAELDPYCKYIPPGKPHFISRIIRGRRFDLGLHFEIVDGEVRVIGPVPESPAHQAGVQAGDILLAVGEHTLHGPDRATVEKLNLGEEGTRVRLLVARDGAPVELEAIRRTYPAETVTGLYRDDDGRWRYMVDPDAGILYVRICEFANGTGEKLDEIMRPLLGKSPRAMVLDLRDNPGGPLREAIEVADRFVDEGLIVLTCGRDGVEQRYPAHEARTYPRMHLVVLINGHTVSAPEVVAGAIRCHDRGVLIGSRTFGKDLIQRPFELGGDMGAVLLTTARYAFREPAESTTQPATAAADDPALSGGIAPHIRLGVSDLAAHRVHVHRYRAAALPAAGPTTRPATQPAAGRRRLDEIAAIDPPLGEAVRVLRRRIAEATSPAPDNRATAPKP